MAHIVEVVADASGYSKLFKVMKLAYSGSELLNHLIESGALELKRKYEMSYKISN